MSHNFETTPAEGGDASSPSGGDPTVPPAGGHLPPPPGAPGAAPATPGMAPPAHPPQDRAGFPQNEASTGQSAWAQRPPAVPPPPGPRRQPRVVRDEERTLAVVAHVSPIVAAVLSVGWLTILGPLVIWALYKDRSPLVRQAAAGAFNFNLVIWAAIVAGWVCLFTIVLFPLALLLWLAAGIVGLVCHIQGAVKASRGEPYSYPLSIPVLS